MKMNREASLKNENVTFSKTEVSPYHKPDSCSASQFTSEGSVEGTDHKCTFPRQF